MDMGELGAAILGGAAGGGVGGLVATVTTRALPEKWKRAATTILVLLLAIVGSRLATNYVQRQQSQPQNIERQLLSEPGFGPLARAWRETDPVSFREAVSTISESLRAGRDRDAAVAELRFLLLSAAMPRMRFLDDAHVVEGLRIARDEFAELKTTQPSACDPVFNGRAFGDMTPYLSEGVRARELALLEAALRADSSAVRATLQGAELDAAINAVMMGTRERVGEDVSLLEGNANIEGRERRYCEVVVAFHDELLELPAHEAAALMRGLR